MDTVPLAIAYQPIVCSINETVRFETSDQDSHLYAEDLRHCISIVFIGENQRKSLSACPCLVFFSKSGRVKFFAEEYLLALINRETVWLGKIERVEIMASYKNPHSAWYLCYAENFFKDRGLTVVADFLDETATAGESQSPANNNNKRSSVCFAEFLLKFLILGVDYCLPMIKYDQTWLTSFNLPKFFLEHLNLSYLLSKRVLNRFIERYHLEDDQQIVTSMIRRNFKVFMHNNPIPANIR